MADRRPLTSTVVRIGAAACVVAGGIVHLQQYFGVFYRVIPTIGPLFLLDFVGAIVLGVALLLPVERWWRPLGALVALGGILFSAGAIVGLEISEHGALFGFHEHGYRLAVVLSLVFEAAAILLLIGYLVARVRTTPNPTDPMRTAMTRASAASPSERNATGRLASR